MLPRKPIWRTADNLSERVEHDKKSLERRRVYSLEYYHAHKKPSQCDCCLKTLSSSSALRRHQRDGLHCKMIKLAKEMEQSNNAEATSSQT